MCVCECVRGGGFWWWILSPNEAVALTDMLCFLFGERGSISQKRRGKEGGGQERRGEERRDEDSGREGEGGGEDKR